MQVISVHGSECVTWHPDCHGFDQTLKLMYRNSVAHDHGFTRYIHRQFLDAMATQMLRELLGVCVVYLGGLNYFFPIRERVPVVSSTGVAVGSLEVSISPFIEASLRRRQSQSGVSVPVFKPYMVADHDREEQQVYEFMDRPLQFVVELGRIEGLRTRRHSHVFARYSFFREALSQTALIPVNRCTSDSSGDGENECVANTTAVGGTAVIDAQFRHVVDVSDTFVKFIASSSLTIEIFGVNPPT